ncbi:Adenylate and Guanylate cyclase catalytic domain containing protein [Trichomonas vaginalis G3]|uniref:Adenylate and Guanylate cyclase catalytic domain containing protein n=1 Tax=Trichomonas vaginalis (strain ATCC PRA-98 / G3) TaxID=412133 RepID=A2FXK2_TRIV3|nr:guanylate cyclase protein [Trichomonas vaginalis G3]EAX90369.1 Adenylate and Guanylate cyclase catalytic domain containing protein [Trichomonas vaginalis G3]KAI5509701.1 guanylate cyclase protein [Trichomonas vaginalis G3]|eukprot:XP_001303299.1 Adenylate and Guanylate cyclase catalytic domain containing protein [Trichomonas vaginalis G3]
MAVNYWRESLGIWEVYAKFAAVYPENTSNLIFILQNVQMLKDRSPVANIVCTSIKSIINTRETRFTPQIKNKISKMTKEFTKTKNRLRNIWDLILQGATNDLGSSIKLAYESVKDSESDINYLMTLFPNNKFVARQHAKFLYEIKCDVLEYKKKMEDVSKLSRGLRIQKDVVHELGMQAIPTIPESSTESQDTSVKSLVNVETESLNIDENSIEDDVSIDAHNSISKQIENHVIPSIHLMYCTTIVAYIFLILIPFIVLNVLFNFFSNELRKPIEYMQGIAFVRNLVNMMPAFVGKHLLQYMPDPTDPTGTKMILDGVKFMKRFPFNAYGGEKTTREIVSYLAMSVASANEMISPLRHFKYENKIISSVRDQLFSTTSKYYYYVNTSYFTETDTSSVQISFMLSANILKLVAVPVVTAELAKGPDSITSRNNNNLITASMNTALTLMVDYIKEQYYIHQKIIKFTFIALLAVNVIAYAIIFLVQIKKLKRNKKEIISVMTELPKTVISNISQSFSTVKGDKSTSESSSKRDAELTRQEESIIKLFSSISDGVGSSIERFNFIMIFLIVITSCLGYYLCMECFTKASDNIFYNCHHINYLYGSITFLFSIFARIWKIVLENAHPTFQGTCINVTDEVSNIERIIPLQSEYFLKIRFGGSDKNEVPFDGTAETVKEASILLSCENPLIPPTDIPESVHCFTAPQQLYYTIAYLKRLVSAMKENPPRYPKPRGDGVNQGWQVGPIELYEAFFYPAGIKLVPSLVDSISRQKKQLQINSIAFILVTFGLSLFILYSAKNEDIMMNFALKQVLRCPTTVIMQNSKIIDLLSGNYSKFDEEETNINFSNEIFNKLNDVVIVCQEETGKIVTVNSRFKEIFGDIDVKTIKDLFTSERFESKSLNKVFSQQTELVYKNIYFEFTNTLSSGNRIYFGTDITKNVMHEKLITEEKTKSDAMLASILPPMLVSRVQAGEKNISFSVQSATVLFLDVVEFTPWCGSHDAHYVMRMLNIMFKEYDAITNSHKTMTKIKCIGDCYMAAGGIFDEVNQPAVHAKEVVDFGCQVIKKLLEIDERENESLRIRVGVNTGGPIVAGVIGTEKPTFEILGPAINIAHEMEHHGVPMKVHISRPVYELIYGQQFDIKERGEIDVKGGKMFTYLVEP